MGEITLKGIEKLLENQTLQINKNTNDSLRILKKTEKRICELQKRCNYLERKLRKNNIIIFGLTLDGSDITSQTITKINNLLDLEFTVNDINNIYKIGNSSNPPIVIEFLSFLKKQAIFKNPEKLKSLKGTNISIANDLCREDRENQKILRKHLKLAKEKNQNARIVGHRLEIDGKFYEANDLEYSDESDYESENNTDSQGDIDPEGSSVGSSRQKFNEASQRKVKPSKADKKPSKKRRNIKTPSPVYSIRTNKKPKH